MRRAVVFLVLFPSVSAGIVVAVALPLIIGLGGGTLGMWQIGGAVFAGAFVAGLTMFIADILAAYSGAGRGLRAACDATVGFFVGTLGGTSFGNPARAWVLGVIVAAVGFVCGLLAGSPRSA